LTLDKSPIIAHRPTDQDDINPLLMST